MKQRLEYIDALRGATMILVVFAHVETFMLSIEPGSTLISALFLSFRMPLFFFISGFIAYKDNILWTIPFYINILSKKIRIQIIPTLFFGLLFTYLFKIGDAVDFIYDYHKFGYWFTISLLGMFFILYSCNLIAFSFFRKRFKNVVLVLLIIIAALMFLFRFLYDRNVEIAKISDVICLHQICTYIPFFVCGYIVSQYKELFIRYFKNEVIMFCIFLLYCILFYIQWILPASIYETNSCLLGYRSVQYFVVGILGIFIVYNLFRKNTEIFSKKTKIGLFLQKIGRRTLDIYMLHYFFLSAIPYIGNYIINTSNVTLELLVVFFLSLIVILCCLLISDILRQSKYFTFFLFGVKNK